MELQIILDILDKAVANGNEVQLDVGNSFFRSYCDTSGQRSAFLSHYIYEDENTDYTKRPEKYSHTGVYQLRRKLTFTNKEDIGKENAILGVLSLKNKTFSQTSISENKNVITIELDNICITIKK